MKLDAILRAHGFMNVERPPELWEVDTEDVRVLPLLGEMIAAALAGGAELGELTLNASNVVVEADSDSESKARPPLPGEYVAVTVRGSADLGPDAAWHTEAAETSGLLARLRRRFIVAGSPYAYIRRAAPENSITVFLPRAQHGNVGTP